LKAVKWLAAIVLCGTFLYTTWICVALFRLPPVAGLADRKINLTIQVKDGRESSTPS
jgi:hypothetical protein